MSSNQNYRPNNKRRKKSCPFSKGDDEPNYLDVAMLESFQDVVSKKIVPSRMSGVSPLFQRRLAKAVKRARILALLPFCDHHRE